MSTTFAEKTVKARKDHRCDYCETQIPAGSTYFKWTGIYDGDFNAGKAHHECDAVARWASDGEWEVSKETLEYALARVPRDELPAIDGIERLWLRFNEPGRPEEEP